MKTYTMTVEEDVSSSHVTVTFNPPLPRIGAGDPIDSIIFTEEEYVDLCYSFFSWRYENLKKGGI